MKSNCPLRIRFVLPRLIKVGDRCRSIKYSLFPPLGLTTLAGYLRADDEADIVDEHVDTLDYESRELDIVAIEVYITCAKRAYRIADEYRRRGVYVVMGGLHPTACPDEARQHADTLVLGPAEETFPRFLDAFRKQCAQRTYTSLTRSLDPFPFPRRDLIERRNYLVPNCVSISRGCPHACDFCYKTGFYAGGKSYYRAALEQAVAEVASLDGKYVFFVDDNLMADEQFCLDFFREIAPMRKVWQAAATVQSLKNKRLLDAAVQAGGLPSLSPVYPAFCLLSCPHPPNPLPDGKGEIFVILLQGASPLASPGAGGARHWLGFEETILFGIAGGRRLQLQSITNSRKVLGGLGASFKKPPNVSPPLASPRAGGTRHWFGFEETIRFGIAGGRRLQLQSITNSRKVLGGFGGFFQEAPNVPSLSRSFVLLFLND